VTDQIEPVTAVDNGNEDRDDEEYIVLEKSQIIIGLVILVLLVSGIGAGYVFFGDNIKRDGAAELTPAGPPRVDNVSVDDDPAFGPEDASVTIVEFSDFQCPYCLRYHQETFDALKRQYEGKIRYVFRDFPLSNLHQEAQKAAEAGECAHEQGKFWEMRDIIFDNQQTDISENALKRFAQQLGLDEEQFNECLDSEKYAQEIAADFQDGSVYGVTGTPTFFINGLMVVGAQPLTVFERFIDQELATSEK